MCLTAALVAGCGSDGSNRGPTASTQGRACQAVEFDVVRSVLGVSFDTAAGAQTDETYTCVIEQSGQSYPDLTVAMSQTAADVLIFNASLVPSGATTVPGLGRVAYQLIDAPGTSPEGSPSGPGVEIGWLSATPKWVVLRYTWAAGASGADLAALTAKLVTLAEAIEAQLVTPPMP
jgi:hypothetical protein